MRRARSMACSAALAAVRRTALAATLCAVCWTTAALGAPDSWSELSSLPTQRRLLAAAAMGGKIYTFGGCGSPCFEPPLHNDTFEETRVEVLDLATGAWSARPPLPAILFGAAAAAPGNGRIYVFGGYLTGNLVLEYDPDTSSWATKSPMPTPRYGLAAVVLDGMVYALGGSGPSGALEVYDPATDRWSRRAPLPTARVFLAAAALGGKIYALGGSPDAAGGSQSAAVEVYDPAADAWTAAAPLPVAEQLSAAAALNGKIYAFGGFVPGSGVRGATYEYDPAANAWTARSPMPAARDQAPAVVADGLAYVLGGSTDCHCRAVGTTEVYTPPQTPPNPSPPCVRLTKTDGLTAVAPGEPLAYRIRVTNCSAAAEEVTVGDAFNQTGLLGGRWCRGVGCPPLAREDLKETLTVAAGAEVLYTITGTVPCGPGPGPSQLVNTACATVAGQPPSCQTDADSVAPPTADVEVTGAASPPPVLAGDIASYHWLVENLGPCPAQAVVLEQRLGQGLVPAAPPPAVGAPPASGAGPGPRPASDKVSCTSGREVVSCQLGTLAPGGPVPVEVRLRVPCGLPAGSLRATAKVTSATTDVSPDDVPDDDTATIGTDVRVVADYAIEFKICPPIGIAGDTVDYTLRVANLGPSCPPAFVSDVLPPQIADHHWCRGDPCVPKSGDLSSEQITLVPGPEGVATFTVGGTLDAAFLGMLSNRASVTILGDGTDPVGSNNSAVCTTRIRQRVVPSNGVAGSCSVSGPFVEGATVTYTYVLTNFGAQAQPDNPGPEFSDILPTGLTLISATADRGTVTAGASTVRWDGSLPGGGGAVTIMVTARIDAGTAGTTLCNQGTLFFVLLGRETSAQTVGPCCLPVTPVTPGPSGSDIPALSGGALAVFGLLLAALAVARLCRRSGESEGRAEGR